MRRFLLGTLLLAALLLAALVTLTAACTSEAPAEADSEDALVGGSALALAISGEVESDGVGGASAEAARSPSWASPSRS